MDDQGRKVHIFTPEQVAHVLAKYTSLFGRSEIVALCESHERLRMELEGATKAAEEINQMLQQVAK